jgi:hypothetical protein
VGLRVTPEQWERMRGKANAVPVPLEKDIQAAIVDYLELRGCVVVRVNGGAVRLPGANGKTRFIRFNRATRGTCSDLLVCYRGRFASAEIKRPGKLPTDGQREFGDAVTKSGGVACVLTSVADAERMLFAIDETITHGG